MASFVSLALSTQHTQARLQTHSLRSPHTAREELSYKWCKNPLCREKKVKQWNAPTGALSRVPAWSANLLCLRCQAASPSLFYTWFLQRAFLDTLECASPGPGSERGALLDAAGCMAQGTVEWFSVRHEPVCS